MIINSFSGPNRFLSNFFIEPDGSHVEGEYQQAKCVNDSERRMIALLRPVKAKRWGRIIEARPDWNEVRLAVMRDLVMKKFRDHQVLADRLIATGDQALIEGNYWNDTFWGVCRGVGANHLGRILMEVRSGLMSGRLEVTA